MDIQTRIRSEMASAPLGSEKRRTLQYILGELSPSTNAPSGEAILRRLLDDNERSRLRYRRNTHELSRIDEENALIRGILRV